MILRRLRPGGPAPSPRVLGSDYEQAARRELERHGLQLRDSNVGYRFGELDLVMDHAEVLVFINQTTTSKENPDGAFAASSVKVGLTKIDGNWLIESFDPV